MSPDEVLHVLRLCADEWSDFHVRPAERSRWRIALGHHELDDVVRIVAKRRAAGLPAPLSPADLLAVPGEGEGPPGPAPAQSSPRSPGASRDW